MMRHLAWGVLGLVTQQVFSQATQPDNLGGFGSFLGWNAGANQTLEVRNDANQPINWFTDAIHRLMLYPTNNATLNTFNVPRNGFVGISPQPLFSSIGREGLRRMIEVFEVQTIPKGEKVIAQGEAGAEAYIVARGELEVVREQEDGEPIVLARLNNGSLFGEMALLSRAPRAASVVACKPSIVLMARKEDLDRVASEQPEVGYELSAYTRRRMVQNLGRTSRVLASVDPNERVALVERFVTRTYEKGDNLVTEGESPKGLHLIASGEVAVVRQDGDETLVIATLTPGDTIGEVSLVLRRAAAADVVAVHPTITLFLEKSDFTELIQGHPLILAQLYHLAVHRDEETSSIAAQDAVMAEGDDFILL